MMVENSNCFHSEITIALFILLIILFLINIKGEWIC